MIQSQILSTYKANDTYELQPIEEVCLDFMLRDIAATHGLLSRMQLSFLSFQDRKGFLVVIFFEQIPGVDISENPGSFPLSGRFSPF